jgi:hypothetical protein
VGERGGDLDFAAKAVSAYAGRVFGAENFDCDAAIVPDIEREIDGRHATATQFALDDVSSAKRLLKLLNCVNQICLDRLLALMDYARWVG